MAFGKRKTPTLDWSKVELPFGEDGRRRIMPDSAWEGEFGEFMKRIGMTPDDPSNVVPNPEDLVAKYRATETAERQVIEQANIQNAALLRDGTRILPLYVVPLEVWDTSANITLMEAFELLPFDDWNRLWLPTGPKSALVLNLFPHPGKEPKWLFDKAMEFFEPCIAKFRGALRTSMQDADLSMEKIHDVMAVKNECSAEIKAYAHTMKHMLAEQGSKSFSEHIAAGGN